MVDSNKEVEKLIGFDVRRRHKDSSCYQNLFVHLKYAANLVENDLPLLISIA